MPRARGWLVALLVGLVLVWAGLLYTGPGPSTASLPASAAGQGPAGSAATAPPDLDAAASRMTARVRASAARLDPPHRNPFRFGERAAADGPSGGPPTLTPLPAIDSTLLRPATTSITLVGLVERTVDGRRERTAVLSVNGELHYVVAGQQLQGGYDVVTVGADVVELRNLADGSTRRLVQR